MAITRSQQARQMLKTAGAVEQDGVLNYIKNSESVTVPKEFKARKNAPATKLAYITADEAKMLKKMKKGTPHKGPKGIPSYDSFDAEGGFTSGAAMSAAERGKNTSDTLAAGMTGKDVQDIRSSVIAAGAGQRVNPGFFDSRNTISPEELRLARAYANRPGNLFAKKAFAKTRGGGLLGFIRSGGITGNLIRSLGQRFGLGKRFDEPTYDMRGLNTRVYEAIPGDSTNPNNLDIYNEFVTDEDDTNIIDPTTLIPQRSITLERSRKLNDPTFLPPQVTPFQKDVIENTQDQADDDIFKDAIAFKPGSIKDRQLKQMYNIFQETGMENPNMRNLMQEDIEEGGPLSLPEDAYRMLSADGGMIGGGIMDAAGRQNYFLGKLVRKAKRAVKKIVKSPIGKLGLMGLATLPFGGPAAAFTKFKALSPGMKYLIGGAGLSSLPLIFGDQDNQRPSGFTGSVGGDIDPRAYTDPFDVLYGSFKAEGGSMKDEPVAKRTMPLLDMGGQEMDLRAEGGFVPIGRMEKADDVPARLSKNEFVFTADAVRNAGDGDVDKGAEVMYNMMKNLEAGGDVSEESQGLEGARNMFQTSKRLEEIL